MPCILRQLDRAGSSRKFLSVSLVMVSGTVTMFQPVLRRVCWVPLPRLMLLRRSGLGGWSVLKVTIVPGGIVRAGFSALAQLSAAGFQV